MNTWKRYSIADLISANALFIGDGYRAKNEELASHGIPFARAGNINNGFQFDDADRFPEKDLHKVGNKKSKPGDVVFTSKGTVGRFAFVKYDTQMFVYSPQLCFWRVLDCSLLDPRYLFFWMSGREFFLQFNGVKGQTDMADYVSLSDQRRMFLTAPSLPEQRAIADVLGSLDDKIELNRRMNETLEQLARALFKSWFVDFDPVRAKAEGRAPAGMDAETAALFPSRMDGEVPEGWRVGSLDQIATYLNGLALQKYPPEEGRYLSVIKIAQMRNNSTENADRASADLDPTYVVNDGDVLFSWSGSLAVMLWCGGKGALNQHLFKVTSKEYPKWFYYLWTLYHLEDFQTIAAGKATTMGHIQRHHLTEARVVIPDNKVLAWMTEQVAPLIDLYIQNSIQSRTLAELRDTLLPRLMSGEIRVKDAI